MQIISSQSIFFCNH